MDSFQLLYYLSLFLTITTISGSKTSSKSFLCPNNCSEGGICLDDENSASCHCFPGFIGVDCSQRACPSGIAWASSGPDAHPSFTECSNMGICDRTTGLCSCEDGFTGPACERTYCKNVVTPQGESSFSGQKRICGGNGFCKSLREAREHTDFTQFFPSYPLPSYNDWDADRIYGCVCDPGWEGPHCQFRTCLKGYDYSDTGVYEEQIISCTCETGTCDSGYVTLSLDGSTTLPIPMGASEAFIKMRIEQMSGVDLVDVSFISPTSTLCSDTTSLTVVTFKLPARTYGSMTIRSSSPSTSRVVSKGDSVDPLDFSAPVSVTGTKIPLVCSGRGICNSDDGSCTCYGGYGPSDGLGNSGKILDCGYLDTSYVNSISSVVTPCYIGPGGICNGHGTCTGTTCSCDTGYTGDFCERLECPKGPAWFSLEGHTPILECSGVGVCVEGVCTECGIFSGEACENIACPNANQCGNFGECLSLKDSLNKLGVTYNEWDAEKIFACNCINDFFVDGDIKENYLNLFDPRFNVSARDDYKRSNVSGVYTPVLGYRCSEFQCPLGHDPDIEGEQEVQEIECTGTGTMEIIFSFRGKKSLPLTANTISDLSHILNSIPTIGRVEIINSGTDQTVCSISGKATQVKFLTENGDLPLLIVEQAGTYTITVSEIVQGTTLSLECSGRGICNRDTGICNCLGKAYGRACELTNSELFTLINTNGDTLLINQ